MEELSYGNVTLEVPSDLCNDISLLFDIISPDTWNNCITDEHREALMNYLPDFAENDLEEKTRTLEMFFMDENFRFGTPLRIFYDYLTKGYFNPKISRMRAAQKKIMFKEYRFRMKEYLHTTLEETLVRRKRVLDIVSNMPPNEIPKIPRLLPNPNKKRNSRAHVEYCTKKRYFRELAAIRTECNDTSDISDDEIYPDGPGASLNKKQRRQLVGLEGALPQDLLSVRGTHSSGSLALDLELRITPSINPLDLTDDHFRAMIQNHRQKRNKHETSVYLDTRGITLQDVIARAQIQTKRPPPKSTMSPLTIEKPKKKIKIKKESPPQLSSVSSLSEVVPMHVKSEPGSDSDSSSSSSSSSSSGTDSDEETTIKKEVTRIQPAVKRRLIGKGVKVKSEVSSDLSSSHSDDMKDHLSSTTLTPASGLTSDQSIKIKEEIKVEIKEEPVAQEDPVAQQIDNSSELTAALESIGACIAPELTQETHICFFSLIRDIICSTGEQRMTKAQLESSIRVWQESAISPLNEWYCTVPSWVNCLPEAINFLCGHFSDVQPGEFVPYIEYKSLLRVYQWIGAGRDSDGHLEPLANFWLAHKSSMSGDWLEDEVGSGKGVETEESEIIPPPRCYTNWNVQPATQQEKELYRQQEKLRYEKPHKAFTFRMHGYESVVGPVKGIYTQQTGLNKARGHSLLVPDRPAYVTILSLVRDAVARLPNGEGTRSDICELLKESQYLAPLSSPTAENNLNSVVSGALDRLHYENDPCVKYDTSRKLWIYLHRNRNEEEFERMHHLNGPGSNKSKKPAARRQNRSKVKDPIAIKGPPNVSLDPLTSSAKIEGNQVKLKPEDIAALTKGKIESGVKMDITPQMATKAPKSITSVKVGGMRGSVGGSSVQTIQVSTAGGVQTIKVALPPGAQNINKVTPQALTKIPTANITKVGSQNIGRTTTSNKLSSHSSKGIALSQSSQQSVNPVSIESAVPSHIAGGNITLSAGSSRAPVVTLTTREASRLPAPSVAQARATTATAATITTPNTQLQQAQMATQIGSGNKVSGVSNVVNMASVATSTAKGIFSSLGGIKVLQASPQQMTGKGGGSSSPVVVNSSTALQQLMGQKMVVSGGKVLVQGGKVIQAISGGMSNVGTGGKQMITGVLPGQQMVTVESLLGAQGKHHQSLQSGVVTSVAGKLGGGNIIQLAGGAGGGGMQRLTLVSSQGQPVQLNAAPTAPTQQRLVLATGPQGVGSTDLSGNKNQVVQTIQTLHAGGPNNHASTQQIAAIAGSTSSSSSCSTASTTTQVINTPIVATAAQPTQQRFIQVTGQQQKAFMQGINVGGGTASMLSGGGIRLVGPGTSSGGGGVTGGSTATGGQAGPTHGNLITIGGKQVLLTSKPFAHQQGQLQQVMLTGGNVKNLTPAAAGANTTGANPGGGAVVVASGSGGQQIVLPASALQGSHLNLKGLQGLQAFHTLKVIPASQVTTQQRGKPVLARIVSPGAVRSSSTSTAVGSSNILQPAIAATTIRTATPQSKDSTKS